MQHKGFNLEASAARIVRLSRAVTKEARAGREQINRDRVRRFMLEMYAELDAANAAGVDFAALDRALARLDAKG